MIHLCRPDGGVIGREVITIRNSPCPITDIGIQEKKFKTMIQRSAKSSEQNKILKEEARENYQIIDSILHAQRMIDRRANEEIQKLKRKIKEQEEEIVAFKKFKCEPYSL